MRSTSVNTILFSVLAFLSVIGLVPDADAYCTNTGSAIFATQGGCIVQNSLHVYINDGALDMARTGIAVDDVERIVRAVIASYNEASVTLPRLIYGGRVSHDTTFSAPFDFEAYKTSWDDLTGGRPLGVTIGAMPCPSTSAANYIGSTADAQSFRSPDESIRFGIIRVTPYQDDMGNVCPRSENGRKDSCVSIPADPDLLVTPCMDGATVPCGCIAGPPGEHECAANDADELVWSGCLCAWRGYEVYNVGDGAGKGNEPLSCDSAGPSGAHDLMGVIMHELGHILGLDHAEKDNSTSGLTCNGILFPGGNTQGIMRSASWVSLLSKARRPHADDLAGFEAFYYGLLDAPWRRDFDLVYYESTDQGVTWGAPNAVVLPTTGIRTRPAVSSASDSSGVQVIAFTNRVGDVYHLVRDADGFQPLTPGQSQVPGANTRFPAAVAYGGGRLMVAWIFDAGFADRHSNVRWMIRDLEDFAWTFGDYAVHTNDNARFIQKEIGLGYDPSAEIFVLSAISSTDVTEPDMFPESSDGKPFLVAIDPMTAEVLGRAVVVDAPVIRSIGKPACHLTDPTLFTIGAHCAIPILAAVIGGPDSNMLYTGLALAPSVLGEFSTIQPLGVPDHGLFDLAADPRDVGEIRFLGAWTTAPAVPPDGSARFEVFRSSALSPGVPPADFPVGVTAIGVLDRTEAPGAPGFPVLPAWPPAIGSQWIDDQLVFSAWRVEPTQSDVEPTTGEDPTGACPAETSSTSGTTSSSTADTGTASDTSPASDTGGPDPGGCACRSSNPAKPTWFLAAFALGLRRRRWRQSEGKLPRVE